LTTDQKVRGSTPLGRAIITINYYEREVAQLGRALGLGPRGRRFESCLPDHFQYGALAQLGERLLCTQEVSGSIPLGSTKKTIEKVIDTTC
jgi:hypothetical protein